MMTSITRSDTVWVRLFLAVLLLAACPGGGRASGVDDRGIATVYVTNWTSNSVCRFELTAGGSLNVREVIPGPAGSANALGAVLSRDKRSLYVASGDPGRFPTSKSSEMAVWWRWAVFPQRRPAQLTVLKWSSHLMAGVHI
jgi:hypothetical protein